MRKLYTAFLVALMALALSATAAFAIVTFDPATGGYAGKGDVQNALGQKNNAAFQAGAPYSFTYTDSAEYNVPCKKETASQTLTNSFKREANVNYTLDVNPKNVQQISGFNLDAVDQGSLGGNVSCPSGWEPNGTPQLIPGSEAGGQLIVTDRLGNSAVIWTAS